MKSGSWAPFLKLSPLHLLIVLSLSFTPKVLALAATDIALIGLLMDSHRLKIETWSEPGTYTVEGPGIDARPLELSMEQRLMHVEDPEQEFESAKVGLQNAARAFSLHWQTQGVPQLPLVDRVESSTQIISDLVLANISTGEEASIRAYQMHLLMQITALYVFEGGRLAPDYAMNGRYDLGNMISEFDALLARVPLENRAFSTKWRYIKPVILKGDYRTPDLVKRHALSMAALLERSLD